jgi:hypothetical protein
VALASQVERVLSKSRTFSYGGTKYCVKTQGPGTSMRGGKVMVHQFADGRLRFSYKERTLTCTAYGTYSMPDPARGRKDAGRAGRGDHRHAADVTRCGATDRAVTRGAVSARPDRGLTFWRGALNRDRGASHDATPPSPPGIRVRTAAVRRIKRPPAYP